MNAKRQTSGKTPGASSSWPAHLSAYTDKRVLRFNTTVDLEAAIDLLWTEPLRSLPHATPDGESLIVPAEALPFFRQAGLQFTSTKLRSIGELPPEEIRRLRSPKGAPKRA